MPFVSHPPFPRISTASVVAPGTVMTLKAEFYDAESIFLDLGADGNPSLVV